jgi:hypothetical protein
MHTMTQFSVFLINKPGVLARVSDAVARAKINVVALTIVDSQEHGVLRVVGDDPARLRDVLAKLNLPTHETPVLAIELSNRPGALATVIGSLAEQHINIEYAYVTAGAPGGKTTGILKTDQLEKAQKVLATHQKHGKDKSEYRNRAAPRHP